MITLLNCGILLLRYHMNMCLEYLVTELYEFSNDSTSVVYINRPIKVHLTPRIGDNIGTA